MFSTLSRMRFRPAYPPARLAPPLGLIYPSLSLPPMNAWYRAVVIRVLYSWNYRNKMVQLLRV
jgi:hypothetical protein